MVSRLSCCSAILLALALAPAAAAEGDNARIPAANPLRGNKALTQKKCITCHSIWGVGGRLGPDLAASGTDQSFQQMVSMFWNHTPRMVEVLKQKGIDWPKLTEQEMADMISFIYYIKLLDRAGDPLQGRRVFEDKRCVSCHSLGPPGPGKIPLDSFGGFISTVPLTQAMWNAGMVMRRAHRELGLPSLMLHGREMADLQAYIRQASGTLSNGTTYLPLPDLARGSELFVSKKCRQCHQADGRKGRGPDLSERPLRKSISETCIILWNHSSSMQEAMTQMGIALPKLEGNDLADILAYIYFLNFSKDTGDAVRGQSVFQTKGCSNCHDVSQSQGKRGPVLGGREEYGMLSLATSMWNHAPIMFEAMEREVMKWIKLDPDDMQDLAKYLKRTQAHN